MVERGAVMRDQSGERVVQVVRNQRLKNEADK